jgi:glutamine amidotransferase
MIAIINYGLGNLTSILNMHQRLGIEAVITADAATIKKAEKLILPGVGHFKKGMENLKESGLQDLLNEQVINNKKPVLGICLGAQLMTRFSGEGNVEGLGWVDASTVAFDNLKMGGLKVPHMGWADIIIKRETPLFAGLPPEPRFYHVHSFHFDFSTNNEVVAYAVYGYGFPVAFNKENIYGTQFHPEKSHRYGMKVLQNFAAL